MRTMIHHWFRRYLSHPEAMLLLAVIVVSLAIVFFLGHILAPVFVSVVIAYLLDVVVAFLRRRGVPRRVAATAVFFLFLIALCLGLLGVVPLLYHQIIQLIHDVPALLARGRQALLILPERYPGFLTEAQISELLNAVRSSVADNAEQVLRLSASSAFRALTLVIYLILVPVLVFFMLSDKESILEWAERFLPAKQSVAAQVWREVHAQIGNYIRGKFAEIGIVSLFVFIVFKSFGLRYSALLAVSVGLSVIVPYIGATLVTFPILFVAYSQWGVTGRLIALAITYQVFQILHGNVLVPWLFAATNKLHPIAIIVAILVFGGLWGAWGIFLAIPLATLVKALINAWPFREIDAEEPGDTQ